MLLGMIESARTVARRGGGLTCLVCAAVLALAAPARAQSSADDLARRHFDSGVAYLQESDYDNALKAFEKAYELSKRPEILLNVATVHERKGELKLAIDSLNSYLAAAPSGDQAETVKIRIANLQKRLDAEPTQGSTPSAEPSTAPAPAAPAPAPSPAAPRLAAPAPAPAAQEPNHIPAYVLFGVGGLTAAGAVVTGLMAQSKYDDAKKSCSPDCTDSQISSSRTLAWTNTALAGVAVVSVGVGAVLFFTAGGGEQPQPAHAAALPRVSFGAAPGIAAAQASWKF